MMRRALSGLILLILGSSAHADGCDALTVRMIRATGASLAGRDGALVVFRAADAERMSLTCGEPRTMLFRSRARRPVGAYFVLIGQAGRALTGADAQAVETLALALHQETLLTGEARRGRAGPLAILCEPGDRPDGFSDGTLCRIAPTEAPRLRRRAGLFVTRLAS